MTANPKTAPLNKTLDLPTPAPTSNPMLIHSIGLAGKLRLRNPINLWVTEDEGRVFAEVLEFYIASDGDTKTEAITDVMVQLRDLYDDLMDTPDEKLCALSKRWKQALQIW